MKMVVKVVTWAEDSMAPMMAAETTQHRRKVSQLPGVEGRMEGWRTGWRGGGGWRDGGEDGGIDD